MASPSSSSPTSSSTSSSSSAAALPSSQMPLWNDAMTMMYAAVKENASLLDLVAIIPDIADEIAKSVFVVMDTTIEHLKKCSPEFVRVLHYVPIPVLNALIRHTVAFDFLPSKANRPNTYSGNRQGVYACGMCVKGRNGAFLSRAEFRRLIAAVNTYVEAATVWRQNGQQWDMTDAHQKTLFLFMRDVDGWFGNPKLDRSPRFIEGADASRFARAIEQFVELRKVFEKFVAWPAPAGTDDVWIRQSPLMVGCTTQAMKDRVLAHFPKQDRSLSNTTKTWAFTLAVLGKLGLEMGFEVDVISIPVVCTHEKGELALAESVFTVLAQSLILQTGFNIIQGGGQSESRATAKAKAAEVTQRRHIYGTVDFFKDNLTASAAEARNKREFVEDFARYQKTWTDSDAAVYRARLDDLQAKIADDIIAINGFKEIICDTDDWRVQMEDGLRALSRAEADARDHASLLSRLAGAVDDIDSE